MKRKKHRIALFIFILLLLVIGGWYYYQTTVTKKEPVRYVSVPVQRSSLIVTVSGSGYTAADSRVDIKPKVSGDLETLHAQSGVLIYKDAVIGAIDDTAAQKELRDARLKLQNVRLALKKIKQPPTEFELLSAQNAINSAQRELEKLQEPTEQSDIESAQNALSNAKGDYETLLYDQQLAYTKAKDTEEKTQEVLEKSRDDAYTSIVNTFLDLPGIKSGIESIATASAPTGGQAYLDSYSDQVSPQTDAARAIALKNDMRKSMNDMNAVYAPTFADFNETTRSSSIDTIESLVDSTIQTIRAMSDTLKRSKNYFDFVETNLIVRKVAVPAMLRTHQTTVQGYIEDVNTHLSQLLSSQRTIRDNRISLSNAKRDIAQMDTNYPRAKDTALNSIAEKERNLEELLKEPDKKDIQAAKEKIKERQQTLTDLNKGSSALDIETQELSVKQNEIAVQDAKERLDDYVLKAPIGGIVAQAPVKRGDAVSPSTVIVSIVTKKKVAEISFNEIDAARVALGMRAALTFDALPTLSLTGEVIEIDTIGKLDQGVVTYAVKIAFDTDNQSVREGMSVTASIFVDSRLDALLVPAGSVQFEGQEDFVQVLENGAPVRRVIKKGISNDTHTEILTGLKQNDSVITQTISAKREKNTNQNQQRSFFQQSPVGGSRSGGMQSIGGGGVRH